MYTVIGRIKVVIGEAYYAAKGVAYIAVYWAINAIFIF